MYKITIALVLSLALLAPKMTATLTSILPGFSVVILCTSSAIERIVLGPDGKPVEIEETDHSPCVTADPDHLRHPLNTDWVVMARDYAPSFVVIAHPTPTQRAPYTRPPSHGPPLLLI